ncbi:MAG TPA: T9SS type A sorting domain-containing protein [Cyclobacteriaceae bacterium]|nr:T9SS type A sorting domain-containing protein [Cyclobacteriaceae bacterium]
MLKRLLTITLLAAGFVSTLSAQKINLFPDVLIKGNPYIVSIAETSDGGYLLGPWLDHVNGVPCGNLAKIDASGNLVTSFNKILTDNHILSTIPLPDGKILTAGWFKNVNGKSTSVLRLNADGTIDNSFQAFVVSAPYYDVSGIALQSNGKIIVVGSFNQSGYNCIARLNSDGSIDNTFAHLDPPYGYLSTLAVDGKDNIYTGDGHRLYKLNSNGAVLPGFPIQISVSEVFYALEPYGDKVIVGGNFTMINNVSRTNMAIVNNDGSIDPFFISGLTSISKIKLTSEGNFLILDENLLKVYDPKGNFITSLSQLFADDFFIDKTGNILISNRGADGFVTRFSKTYVVDNKFVCKATYTDGITAIAAQSDGKIIFGTQSIGIGGSIKKMVRVGADGKIDSTFNSAFNATDIKSIAVQPDDKILACSSGGLARLNSSGSRDTTFVGSGLSYGFCSKVKIRNNFIFLSGYFDEVKDYKSPGIVMLNMDGSINQTFKSNLPDGAFVTNFEIQSNHKIIVTGTFTFNNTFTSVVRLNEDGTLDDSFTRGYIAANGVWQVAVDSKDRIYIGGDFFDYNGKTQSHIARLTPDGVLDNTYNPLYQFDVNSTVEVLELLSDNEIVTGAYSGYNIVAIDVHDSNGNLLKREFSDLGSNSSLSASYFNGETLYLAGRIVSKDNSEVSGIASVNITPVTGKISGLQVTRADPLNATLTWENYIAHGTRFSIERSAHDSLHFEVIDTVPISVSNYNDHGVQGNEAYYYRVKAINTSSSTAYSNDAYLDSLLAQTITFDLLADKMSDDADFVLSASATSGLDVTFESSDVSIASINNNIVTINKGGDVTITAYQYGNAIYNSATPVSRSLSIKTITGVDKPEEKSMSAYPNPVTGVVHIPVSSSYEGGIYSVIDSNGVLKSKSTVTTHNGVLDINMTTFSRGLYLIKIENMNSSQYSKIIRE